MSDINEHQIQSRGDRLVGREVMACLSTLVGEFIQRDPEGFMDAYPDLVGGYVENEEGEEEYLEIYEYWAVSSWLAEKLSQQGERVDQDFYGLCIWGRTCTGQAISMDSVIGQVVADTDYASHES